MKVLFITHDASKTGAPFTLYNFLKRVRENNEFDFEVLSLMDGPLIKLFQEFTTVHLFSKKQHVLKRGIKKYFKISYKTPLEKFLLKKKFDLYYINSISSLARLPNLDFLKNNKSIFHVHELDINIRKQQSEGLLNDYIGEFNKVICVSKMVLTNLVTNYNLDKKKSNVIYPFSREIVKENILKKELGLPSNAFVVGGCGHIDITKGMDFFINVAAKVLKGELKKKPIYFCWLGNQGNMNLMNHLNADIIKMGLQGNLKIIETTDNPESVFANFDIFFLSSREDSFPLVAIENAKMGKPVICFNKGNGFVEFIEESNGIIVPYFDIDKTAEEILRLYNDEELCHLMGKEIEKDSLKFDNTIIYKKLVSIINEC